MTNYITAISGVISHQYTEIASALSGIPHKIEYNHSHITTCYETKYVLEHKDKFPTCNYFNCPRIKHMINVKLIQNNKYKYREFKKTINCAIIGIPELVLSLAMKGTRNATNLIAVEFEQTPRGDGEVILYFEDLDVGGHGFKHKKQKVDIYSHPSFTSLVSGFIDQTNRFINHNDIKHENVVGLGNSQYVDFGISAYRVSAYHRFNTTRLIPQPELIFPDDYISVRGIAANVWNIGIILFLNYRQVAKRIILSLIKQIDPDYKLMNLMKVRDCPEFNIFENDSIETISRFIYKMDSFYRVEFLNKRIVFSELLAIYISLIVGRKSLSSKIMYANITNNLHISLNEFVDDIPRYVLDMLSYDQSSRPSIDSLNSMLRELEYTDVNNFDARKGNILMDTYPLSDVIPKFDINLIVDTIFKFHDEIIKCLIENDTDIANDIIPGIYPMTIRVYYIMMHIINDDVFDKLGTFIRTCYAICSQLFAFNITLTNMHTKLLEKYDDFEYVAGVMMLSDYNILFTTLYDAYVPNTMFQSENKILCERYFNKIREAVIADPLLCKKTNPLSYELCLYE